MFTLFFLNLMDVTQEGRVELLNQLPKNSPWVKSEFFVRDYIYRYPEHFMQLLEKITPPRHPYYNFWGL